MKKVLAALVLVSISAPAYSQEFSLENLKAADLSAAAAEVSPVSPAEAEQVPQDLVYKFERVKNDLWKLESDTTWLRSDIDRLESTARRIAQNGSADAFFQHDLQRMVWDFSRYNNEALRLRDEVRGLLNLARKDQKLNQLSRDMDWDARRLLNRAQFEIENSAQRLEWAVRSAKPELIGYNSQWQAMDLSRAARDFTWRLRDLSFDAQNLVTKTQP